MLPFRLFLPHLSCLHFSMHDQLTLKSLLNNCIIQLSTFETAVKMMSDREKAQRASWLAGQWRTGLHWYVRFEGKIWVLNSVYQCSAALSWQGLKVTSNKSMCLISLMFFFFCFVEPRLFRTLCEEVHLERSCRLLRNDRLLMRHLSSLYFWTLLPGSDRSFSLPLLLLTLPRTAGLESPSWPAAASGFLTPVPPLFPVRGQTKLKPPLPSPHPWFLLAF